MANATRQLNVSLPADVKEQVVADAQARGVSINDVYASVLAEAVGYAFTGTGRPSRGAKGDPDSSVNIRLPGRLYERVAIAALRKGLTKRAWVERTIRGHYLDVAAVA